MRELMREPMQGQCQGWSPASPDLPASYSCHPVFFNTFTDARARWRARYKYHSDA